MAGGWTGPRRHMVGVKLADEVVADIDRLAEAEGLLWNGKPNTSEMIRRLVDEALTARRGNTARTG